jgi:predicted CXXCH cytochrome family protein
VYPLQQYLLPLDRGRLQALTVAWDSRSASEGGQRWFHLYPDETIPHGDPLHWTGPYQNWNTRCAECHSTDVEKQYSAATRSFDTRFKEVNVGCEACHGPGASHVALANDGKLADAPAGGFELDLAQRGQWMYAEGADIARRRQALDGDTQIDTCGRCHARRGTLGDYHYGADLLDTHRLSMLNEPLYYPDGQIRDEVYVYGSFVQSKMHMEGVVCSNCHEPHSNELRAEGNGVCAQCHRPDTYDTPDHHRHPVSSTGASCANCHMPETTYMVVDPRRDHSMRIPRPDLSVMIGVPNACNQCHSGESAQWALDAVRDWGVKFSDSGSHPARAFHSAQAGDMRALPRLASLARNTAQPTITRATAMEVLGQMPSRESVDISREMLASSDPMLRASAVRSLQALPAQNRFAVLMPLANDPVTTVRMEVASSLADVPLDQLNAADAQALLSLFNEYKAIQTQHADMPSVQMQLAVFYGQRGDYPSAERAYREALAINPQLVPAYLNLADLLRGQQREQEARALLETARTIAPQNAATLHALGLLETRAGNNDEALELLGQAAALETSGTRHRFVYAVALHDLGRPEDAIAQLEALNRAAPDNQEVLLALANYNAELEQLDSARRYATRLVELAPDNPGYRQLQRQLGGG